MPMGKIEEEGSLGRRKERARRGLGQVLNQEENETQS